MAGCSSSYTATMTVSFPPRRSDLITVRGYQNIRLSTDSVSHTSSNLTGTMVVEEGGTGSILADNKGQNTVGTASICADGAQPQHPIHDIVYYIPERSDWTTQHTLTTPNAIHNSFNHIPRRSYLRFDAAQARLHTNRQITVETGSIDGTSQHTLTTPNTIHHSFNHIPRRSYLRFDAAQARLQALVRPNFQSWPLMWNSTRIKNPKPKDLTKNLSTRFDASRARLQVLMDPDFQSQLLTEDIARINHLMLSCLASSAVLSTAVTLINQKRNLGAQAVSYAKDVALHLEDLETHIEIEEERLQK
jgi:hypothetical protein